MKFLMSVGLTALLAVSLHADTITSLSLSASLLQGSTFSNSGASELSGKFSTSMGWTGSFSLIADVGDGSFYFPVTLDLTDFTATCNNLRMGCGVLDFTFQSSFQFSGAPADLYGPYSVSMTGSGPALSLMYQVVTGETNTKPFTDPLSAGAYNFSTQGSLVSTGSVSNTFNDSLSIGGSIVFSAPNGNFSLPSGEGLEFEVGTSDAPISPPSTPEPGTLSLAGGFFLLSGLTAWGWRLRRAAPRRS